jgi:acetyl-CoA carboxylase beta subunit
MINHGNLKNKMANKYKYCKKCMQYAYHIDLDNNECKCTACGSIYEVENGKNK